MQTHSNKTVIRDRKHPQLWQSYLWWDELVQLRKRHVLRVSAIERGDCNMDAQFDRDMMEHAGLDALVNYACKTMTNYGESMGPVWGWITSIRGLASGSLAAQLLAQIDDISRFDTVSKLWRFAGYAVINGAAEKNHRGEKSHYNARLKSVCYLVADQFIKQRTPIYREMYDEEKERQHRLHPVVMCRECEMPREQCQSKKAHHQLYNDAHLHNRAWRKTIKVFLQHLWLVWREAEGLPVSEPYVEAVMGHTHIVRPERVEMDIAAD